MTSVINNEYGINEDELFAANREKYGADYNQHLLDQYTLYVEMADKISSRRAIANTFFLSINTVLIAIMGLLSSGVSVNLVLLRLWAITVALAAIGMSLAWRSLIRTYKDLNTAKFNIINSIEKYLPASGYATEWSFLKSHQRKKRYRELTLTESRVPLIFILLYFILIVVTSLDLINLIFQLW